MVSALETQPTRPQAMADQAFELQPRGSQAVDDQEEDSRHEMIQANAKH